MKFLRLTIVPMLALALSPISFHATAADLNLPGLTGTINTTITSGISLRAEDMDCKLQDGRSTAHSNAAIEALGLSSGYLDTAPQSLNTKFNSFTAAGQANIKGTNKNSAGCGTARTDGYGNTSTNAIPLGDVNSDDGSLNFQNAGDVVDATQKLFF